MGMTRARARTRLALMTPVETESAGEERMARTDERRNARRTTEAASAALDVMLADAALEGRRRFVTPGPAVGVAAGLARRPVRTARRVAGLGVELDARRAPGARGGAPAGATGASPTRPGRRTGCCAACCRPTSRSSETVDDLISDAHLDWRARAPGALRRQQRPRRARADATSRGRTRPCIKETVDQGGANLVRGARRFAGDFPQRCPPRVDTREVRGRRQPRADARARSCCAPRSSS